jgi:hypothetical protein
VLGRVEVHVVDVAGVLHAHPPPGEAAHEIVVRHLDEQRRGEPPLEAGERLTEGIRLMLVAWEAVEQEAVAGVAGGDALDDHPHDHLVGDELAGVHVALGLAAELGALGHLCTQHVAGGDVRQPEVFVQAIGLGALAGARRAKQDQVQFGHNPSSLSALGVRPPAQMPPRVGPPNARCAPAPAKRSPSVWRPSRSRGRQTDGRSAT